MGTRRSSSQRGTAAPDVPGDSSSCGRPTAESTGRRPGPRSRRRTPPDERDPSRSAHRGGEGARAPRRLLALVAVVVVAAVAVGATYELRSSSANSLGICATAPSGWKQRTPNLAPTPPTVVLTNFRFGRMDDVFGITDPNLVWPANGVHRRRRQLAAATRRLAHRTPSGHAAQFRMAWRVRRSPPRTLACGRRVASSTPTSRSARSLGHDRRREPSPRRRQDVLGVSAIPFDPLIAEAKHRMRRRRVVLAFVLIAGVAVAAYGLGPGGWLGSFRTGSSESSAQALAHLVVPIDRTEREWRKKVSAHRTPANWYASSLPAFRRRALEITRATGAVPIRVKVWSRTTPAAVEIVAGTTMDPAEYLRHRAKKWINAFPRPVFVRIVGPRREDLRMGWRRQRGIRRHSAGPGQLQSGAALGAAVRTPPCPVR